MIGGLLECASNVGAVLHDGMVEPPDLFPLFFVSDTLVTDGLFRRMIPYADHAPTQKSNEPASTHEESLVVHGPVHNRAVI